MKIYKDIKDIALAVQKIKSLGNGLTNSFSCFNDFKFIDWSNSEILILTKDDIDFFKEHDGITDNYYVSRIDDYSGYLYFKTNVRNHYVKVYVEC